MTGKTNYPPPYSLRLTFEERQLLEKNAGPLPLSIYIRERLFDAPSPRKRAYRKPVKDEAKLAQLLAELGRSNLANNLNQLAKANHSGSLPLTKETEEMLREACADVEALKKLLIEALGIRGTS